MTFQHPIPDPEVFTDEEAPTRPDGEHAEAATLLSDWRACTPDQRGFLSRTARRLAEITRKRTGRRW